MEREVFENEAIAAVMNRYFVNIKVDREERPDVDRIYVTALQAISGRGGWPMSMFLTPDLKPFYGTTYIPADRFPRLMQQMQTSWTKQPDKIAQYGKQLTSILRRRFELETTGNSLSNSILNKGFQAFLESYDSRFSGFGSAPKFPRPVTFNFLLRYHWSFRHPKALQVTLTTLRKMAEGGIFDHVGGGFHRYSVDQQWRVPHFEKMLYDQAQLACSYLDAHQITRKRFYASVARASVARQTLDYVLNNLAHPQGGFYSAKDAESAPIRGNRIGRKREPFTSGRRPSWMTCSRRRQPGSSSSSTVFSPKATLWKTLMRCSLEKTSCTWLTRSNRPRGNSANLRLKSVNSQRAAGGDCGKPSQHGPGPIWTINRWPPGTA